MRNTIGIIRVILFLTSLVTIISTGCKRQIDKIDTSSIELEITIERFEKELFEQEFENLEENIPSLRKKYGDFFELFNEHIILIGNSNSPAYPEYLLGFITNYEVNQAYYKVRDVYEDVEDIEKKITRAFKRYKYYFPDKVIPNIYTYVSGFNQSIVVDDSILAIGLDKYLGRDCEFYDRLGWPDYMIRNMHREKIVPDCMYAWIMTEFPMPEKEMNLMEHIVYYGKIYYLEKKLIPETADSLIFGFTSDEIEFCEQNEKQMWTFLIEHNLLFKNDPLTIRKFTMEGPFTKDFTRNSPARAVNWLGLQIIYSYMKKNPETSIPELLYLRDYEVLLKEAKYNP